MTFLVVWAMTENLGGASLIVILGGSLLGYRSYRAFARKAQEARYQMIFDYRPGDLVAFDNRRVLHGRNGYDALGGERFIEGIYSDRDDLLSAIRTTRRHLGLVPQD